MPACSPSIYPDPIEKMDLSKYFSTPEKIVAKELGISLTSLKKICRQKGISRWPYRKVPNISVNLLMPTFSFRFVIEYLTFKCLDFPLQIKSMHKLGESKRNPEVLITSEMQGFELTKDSFSPGCMLSGLRVSPFHINDDRSETSTPSSWDCLNEIATDPSFLVFESDILQDNCIKQEHQSDFQDVSPANLSFEVERTEPLDSPCSPALGHAADFQSNESYSILKQVNDSETEILCISSAPYSLQPKFLIEGKCTEILYIEEQNTSDETLIALLAGCATGAGMLPASVPPSKDERGFHSAANVSWHAVPSPLPLPSQSDADIAYALARCSGAVRQEQACEEPGYWGTTGLYEQAMQ